MKKIIDTLTISTDDEAKKFESILTSFLVDSTSPRENAKLIYNIYSNQNNLKFIDNLRNNQKALYIALNGENEELFDLLLSDFIKNKSYSLLELNKISVQADLDNILLLIANDIQKECSSFDITDIKAKKRFISFCSEYFSYKCSPSNDNKNVHEQNLLKIVDVLKIKYEKNQYSIMTQLLLFEAKEPFMNLLNSIKSKSKKINLLEIILPEKAEDTTLNEEMIQLINTLKLNCQLDKSLSSKNKIQKPKFKV